jgi:hypothetical protein
MQKKFRVKKDYVYVNQGGRPQGPGTELILDPVDDYVKKQLWKLDVIGDVETPRTERKHIPVPTLVESAEKLVDDLAFLKEKEPPKVIVDPDAVKPGEGVEKEEAETMLSRVQDYIDKQKDTK